MLRTANTVSRSFFTPKLQQFHKQLQNLRIPAFSSQQCTNSNKIECRGYASATSEDPLFQKPIENEKWHQLREMYNPDQLDQAVQNLVDVGYSRVQAGKIILSDPSVTRVSRDIMQQTLLHLESFGFKTEVRQRILSEFPALMRLSSSQLKRNYNELQHFLGSNDAKVAITKSPEVLSMNQQTVKRTFNYCVEAMGLNPGTVVNSGILQHDFKFVKLRHSLLERAGYYKFPELLKKDGTEKNPSVKDMFFTSDEKFVSVFSGLTIEDYFVYEEMVASQEDELDSGDEEDQLNDFTGRRNNYNALRKKV